MQLWIEGYRSHNKKLSHAIESASFYYGTVLLGKRMVNNIELDIKLILFIFFILIIFTHRKNISNLKNKTEQKIKI